MNKMITIDKNMVNTLVNDARFLQEFPMLKSAQKSLSQRPKSTGCSRCQKKRLEKWHDQVVNGVLTMISKMGAADRTKLKTMLNTEKAQIDLVGRNNQKVRVTF